MVLAKEDILFIKQHLREWLAEQRLGKQAAVQSMRSSCASGWSEWRKISLQLATRLPDR